MANKAKITKWLVENRASMNPQFTEYNWPSRYFRGLHDFEARIEVNGVAAAGRGIDFDPELAAEKASAEAIERFICGRLNISSEGVAMSGCSGADEHAKNEALERYYLSEHLRLQRPLTCIAAPIFTELSERFYTQNAGIARLRFYHMDTRPSLYGIFCLIEFYSPPSIGPGITGFLGLALGDELDRAATRSLSEALANYACFMDSPEKYIDEIKSNDDAWASHPGFIKSIRHLLVGDVMELSIPEPAPATAIQDPSLVKETLDISAIQPLRSCPINPVRFTVKRSSNDEVA